MLTETTERTESASTQETASRPASSTVKQKLLTLIARIRRDSRRDAGRYLEETEVPHGGE